MKIKNLLFTVMLILFHAAVFAQGRVIKGVIKDSKTNEGLPGVAILVSGTSTATTSDVNGAYSITVEGEGKKLVFSYVGYVNQTVPADKDVIDISLVFDATLLKETVVTAVGISREKKSLGYASQEVKGDAVQGAREMNVINSLEGKVAGLNITSSSGAVGASSNITLRGPSSFTGNNSPLFIINGVPVDNDFRSSRTGSPNQGNPISDLNPDDILSINVLKGPVAAALYGSRAMNGAIIVTTKNGLGVKGKTSDFLVSYNTSYSMDKVLRLPEFQNKFGQGYLGDDPSTSSAFMSADESWGAPLDGRPYVNYRGNNATWDPQPDNIKDFFVTGSQFTNAISVASGDDKGAVRFSLSSFNQKGTVPNTAYNKYNAGLSIYRQLTKRLSTELGINYTLDQGKNRPGVGYDTYNPLQSLFGWFGRQVDMKELEANYNTIDPSTGLHYNWNPVYHNNPYWTLYNNPNSDRRDRAISTVKFGYKINDWLSANIRAGSDFYVENRFQQFKKGTIDYAVMQNGGFYDDRFKKSISNIDAMLVGNKKLSNNFSLTSTLGYNYFRNTYWKSNTEVDGLLIPDLYNVSFAANPPIVSSSRSAKEIVGIYGLVSLGYKDFLYLDVTGRNDISSTLPSDNRSYFYPSVSGSFIFSELMKDKKWLSFGKLRAGLAFIGNDTDPYNLTSYKTKGNIGADPSIINNPFNGAVLISEENSLKNPNLKAESGSSFEVGTDVRFFESRVGLDVTYYSTTTKDIIVPVSIPSSSGYSSTVINAGKIRNNGIEIMLNLIPIKTQTGFTWDMSVSFGKNMGKILEVADGLDKIFLARDWADLYLVKGESYGTLYGNGCLKDPNGNYLISPTTGRLIKDPAQQVLGNVTPDFRMGIENTLTYKAFSFGFLIDMQQGGLIYSQTNMWMDYSGLSKRTEDRPDDPNVANSVNQGMVAVNTNGVWTSTGVANTMEIDPETYWEDHAYKNFSNNVYDASYVKLRQINFGYALPDKLIGKGPFSKVEVGLYARNVLILSSKLPYMDPEVNSSNSRNAYGFESNAIPSSRSIGANLKVVF
jgi:TonB-linked SusC/RagA family outer membrane protein